MQAAAGTGERDFRTDSHSQLPYEGGTVASYFMEPPLSNITAVTPSAIDDNHHLTENMFQQSAVSPFTSVAATAVVSSNTVTPHSSILQYPSFTSQPGIGTSNNNYNAYNGHHPATTNHLDSYLSKIQSLYTDTFPDEVSAIPLYSSVRSSLHESAMQATPGLCTVKTSYGW